MCAWYLVALRAYSILGVVRKCWVLQRKVSNEPERHVIAEHYMRREVADHIDKYKVETQARGRVEMAVIHARG